MTDPDQLLALIGQHISVILGIADAASRGEHTDASAADLETHAVGLAATVNDLDSWLRTGGFVPRAWEREQPRVRPLDPVVHVDRDKGIVRLLRQASALLTPPHTDAGSFTGEIDGADLHEAGWIIHDVLLQLEGQAPHPPVAPVEGGV